ncbi:MAG TPA: class I SAM-dependent methyltransferase [Luteolibacter sp.]|nr:class I SAM-dependent methyltransferase [Luteolibacter sp.]
MKPSDTGDRYDRIAHLWQRDTPATYGIAALQRAIRFAAAKGAALDVGCGSECRFLRILADAGFAIEGLDVSARMIELAREMHPTVPFHHADIATWQPTERYAFISAWDSTFHLPIADQRPVMEKLCDALVPGGVVLFTFGGGPAGEISGSFHDLDFDYSTLGTTAFLSILADRGCECRHLEYDQHPENHVFIIAVKDL